MKHLAEIFAHQRELMARFHHIEIRNLPELGFVHYDPPLNLNDMRAQLRLKEYAARITEELVESKMAGQALSSSTAEDKFDLGKSREEVIDALHFLVEMFILIGFEAAYFDQPDPDPDFFVGDTFQTVMAVLWTQMNMLRYRPWKQSPPPPIEAEKFRRTSLLLWHRFTDILAELDMTPDDVYAIYIGKNQVNHGRIASGV